MIAVDAILVLLLYIILVYDVIEAFRGPKDTAANRKIAYVRPRPTHALPGKRKCGGASTGVDSLWRKMKQATQSAQAQSMTYNVITQVMAEARAEQQRAVEQQRIAAHLDHAN